MPVVEVAATPVEGVVLVGKCVIVERDEERMVVGFGGDVLSTEFFALTIKDARKLRRLIAMALTEPPPDPEDPVVLPWPPPGDAVIPW